MFTDKEASEIIAALKPVRDKIANERGVYGTSQPINNMAWRIKVKGVGVEAVRQHEALTDERLAVIDRAIAKAHGIVEQAGDALAREWGGDPTERPPLPPADQVTLWKQAALLLSRLKSYRKPPAIGLDPAVTDSVIQQAEDNLTEIVPPGIEDWDIRQVRKSF